jgi:uncharacterized membrane protein YfcA
MQDLAFFALAVVAGAVAGVSGFGIGSLLTPALAVSIGTRLAVGVVAIPHFVATSLRLWMLRAAVDRGVLMTFGLASAAGGLAGGIAHGFLGSSVLSVVLGLLLVFAGLSELSGLARRLRFEGRSAIAAGALSGLFGGLVGNQGGIRAAALLAFPLNREALVATATATGLLVDAARVPVYLVTDGPAIAAMLPTAAVMTVGAVIGTVLGTPVLRRLPETWFRRMLAALLVVLGVALVAGIGR